MIDDMILYSEILDIKYHLSLYPPPHVAVHDDQGSHVAQ